MTNNDQENDQQRSYTPLEYILSGNGPPDCQEPLLGSLILQDVRNLRATSRVLNQSHTLSSLTTNPSYLNTRRTGYDDPFGDFHLQVVDKPQRSMTVCNPCYLDICEQSDIDLCPCAKRLDEMLSEVGWSCKEYVEDHELQLVGQAYGTVDPNSWKLKCVVCSELTMDRSWGQPNMQCRRCSVNLEDIVWCLHCSKPWHVPRHCSQEGACECAWHTFVRTERNYQRVRATGGLYM